MCSVEGCPAVTYAKGYCKFHYQRKSQGIPLTRPKREVHGLKDSKEYAIWTMMKQRCHNPSNKDYASYGGSGIVVCDSWRYSFSKFLEDMGPKPEGLELDRFPDTAGPYCKENCRWATRTQQNRNKAGTKLSEDIVKTIRDSDKTNKVLASEYGVTAGMISKVRRGDNWKDINEDPDYGMFPARDDSTPCSGSGVEGG